MLNFFHKRPINNIQKIDAHAGVIISSIVKLADTADNVAELANLSSALYQFMLGSEAEKTMQHSLYSLDEYMNLRLDQCNGKPVNEAYMRQLRDELLER